MKPFWKDLLERAIKTFAQSGAAFLTSGATGILDVDFKTGLSVTLLATAISVLTSLGSFHFGDDSASLINTKPKGE
jgi:hypothetical protein